MKTFITNIFKFVVVATVFLGGAAFAMAGNFESQPPSSVGGNGSGFLTLSPNSAINGCPGCANSINSVSIDAPNPGDTDIFSAFMYYRNNGSGDITNARARLNVSGNTLTGTLSGSGASSITDTANLTNLPSSYDIDVISVYTRNTQGSSDPQFCGGYDYRRNGSAGQLSGSGVTIGDFGMIDDVYSGVCSQAYVYVTYEVTNTERNIPVVVDPIVSTENPSNIDETSAVLNGEVNQGSDVNVWFRYSTNPNTLSCSNGTLVNGPNSEDAGDNFNRTIVGLTSNTTYYYIACGEDNNGNTTSGNVRQFRTNQEDTPVPPTVVTQIETRTVNIFDEDSAVLRGRLNQGDNVDVYFVYDDSNNISCTSGGTRVDVATNVDASYSFDKTITGLDDDTTYYYRACAEDNGTLLDTGDREDFTTDSVNETVVNTRQVETLSSDDVIVVGSNGQATLRGRITSGSSNFVYFVWGLDGVTLSCTSNSSNQNRLIAQNHTNTYNSGNVFTADLGGLNENNDYQYRACASDNTLNPDIAQGNLEDIIFEDDATNLDDSFFIETRSEQNVTENSAELRGSVDTTDSDVDNIDLFFVWGEDLSEIEDVDNEDTYRDVNTNGDNIRKRLVRENFDGDQNFEEDVSGLSTDERIYFRFCAEYETSNGDDAIKCGVVEEFDTRDSQSNNGSVNIVTNPAQNITRTTARMCGEVTDGGSDVVSWIEFRTSTSSQTNESPRRQRGEVAFCEDVSNLQPGTSYRFRACTEERCGVERSFTTPSTVTPEGTRPFIFTEPVTNIRSNSATLNSNYVANAPTATCRFNYGRTQALGQQTRSYNVNGLGQCPHNFTNLASGTQYCVQATITTEFGTDTGSIRCFNTPAIITTGGPTPAPRPVTPVQTVVVEDEDDQEELNLGFGLSLVRLEIDDQDDSSIQGDTVEYIVEWENISELDLRDLDMRIEIPQEIEITDVTRGRFDQNSNIIFFTINELDGADFENDRRGESGQMSIFGTVGRGIEGNLLTADAELAYDNPINDAQENARDFDINSYRGSQLTASVFGLANITFLGWLVIALGLFIIFLIARWLYLEREELRAQSYIGGGYPNQPYGLNGGYNPNPPQQVPMYRDPSGQFNQVPPAAPQMPPMQQAPQNDYYEPYRPNRG